MLLFAAILNLPADSPDAKIFKSATEDSSTSSASASTSSSSSDSPSSDTTKTKTTNTNYGQKLGQKLAVTTIGSSVLFFFFF